MNFRFLLFGAILFALTAGTLAFAGKKNEEMARAEFSVRQLTCVACAKKIENALADLPGITSTEVDVAAGRTMVTFAPAKVSAGAIAETISAAGYPAGLLRVVAAGGTNNATAAGVNKKTGAGCACCN